MYKSTVETLKLKKSPESLLNACVRKCLQCDLFWSMNDQDANALFSQIGDRIANNIQTFACNVFEVERYQKCCMIDDKRYELDDKCIFFDGDATLKLIQKEYTDQWFSQLYDNIDNWSVEGVPLTVWISYPFYEKLQNCGFFLLLCQQKTVGEMKRLLLLLAGDVETNPGPTYKDQCKQQFSKHRIARAIAAERRWKQDLDKLKKNSNKNSDFCYLKEQMEEIDANFQIGSLLGSGVTSLASMYLGYRTDRTISKANKALDCVADEIAKTLSQFRETFSDVKSFIYKGLNVIDLVGDIMMGLLQIAFAQPGKKLASLSVEIFRLMTKYGIVGSLFDSIRTFTHAHMEEKNVHLQVDGGDFLKFAGEITPTHVVTFMVAILSGVFLKAIPRTSHMENILKRVGDICRSAKNVVDFNTTMHNSLTWTLDYFKREILNIRPQVEIENFISGLSTWFDDVEALLAREDEWKKSDQILRDPAVVVEVENLYKRGLEFSREISEKKMQREMTLPFQTHMRYMSDLMKQVDTSGAFGTRPRTQPVVVWIFGESGVGKSGMSWPLAVDLNNMFVPNEQEAKEFSKNIYMRNVEQEFWDNYQGQNVVIYDDFGQRVDSTSKPNEEFMELIRTANIAPYPLHMAHLEDKRKTRFTSKVLILTSNVFEQNVNSLTFPDAFRRRIDLCARITNKKEFTKEGYSAGTGKSVQRLDKRKVQLATGEVVSTDVYEIELVNPESGIVLESALSYEDFVERCTEAASDAFESSRKMNDFLERYAVRRFKEQEMRKNAPKILITPPTPVMERRNVKLQINDDSEVIVDYLDNYSLQEIKDLINQGMIVDEERKVVSLEQVLLDAYVEFNGSFDPVSLDEFTLAYMREHLRYRETKRKRILRRTKENALSGMVKWKDEAISYSKNHPFVVAGTVIAAVSSIFLISKFWTRIIGRPQSEVKKVEKADLMGVEVKPYTNEKAIDLSECNQSTLVSILPTILTEAALSAGVAVVLRKPYPLIIGMIAGLKKGVAVYVRNRIFDWHGVNYELMDPAIKQAFDVTDKVMASVNIPFIEAQTSGDQITLKQTRPKIEASVSADERTLKQHTPRIEAHASGDCRTLVKPRVRMELEEIPANMQVWVDQVAQNVITHNIFGNLYKLCRIRKVGNVEQRTQLLHGLFVRDNIMLVPGHLRGFLNSTDEIELINSFDVVFRVPWSSVGVTQIYTSHGETKEAILLRMPKSVSAHKDIVKHFSDATAMGMYRKARVCLPTLRYSEKHKRFLMFILGTMEAQARDRPLRLNDHEKDHVAVLREGLEYFSPTTNGDCGSPMIVNETQVLRKIAGIHVAADDSGKSYSESITQSDLERAFEEIPAKLQIQVDFDDFVVIKKDPIDLPMFEEFKPEDYMECNLPSMKFLPVGVVADVPFEPCKTDIRPSLVHGKIDKILTKPAHLKNVVREGEIVDIKAKNLQKCAMDTPHINSAIVNRAYNFVKQKWLAGRRPELARILTWEESIKGSPDSEFIGPINRQSSPGYPWIFKRIRGTKGKTGWFGDDEYVLSDEVKSAVDYRISQARKGIRVPTVWVDTLKDERRPIKKVDELKTRVFSNGPMDYSLAFRQYFLGFIAHLMENRIENEISLGTNVYSQDWKKTARKLRRCGKKVIAGDFSTFDGTLNSCLMARFVDLANEFYSDGEENALIRHVLFLEVYNSVHLCNGSIYMMTHSQPSGNPATTPLNCFINSMGLRICFEICARWANTRYTMKDFDEHVSIVSYGDDNVVNFSDCVAPWYNMDTITKAFAQIGFIYTDETKSESGTAPLWRELKDVAYLKRGFRFDEERGVWEAPLSMDTILEMPNWCRGGLDIEEGTRVNCENAIMELSMHPKPTFLKWKEKICQAFVDSTGNYLNTDTYEGYAQRRFLEYYL